MKELHAAVSKLSRDLKHNSHDEYRVLTMYNSGSNYLDEYDRYGKSTLIGSSDTWNKYGFPQETANYIGGYSNLKNSLLSSSNDSKFNELMNRSDVEYDTVLANVLDSYENHLLSLGGIYRFHNDGEVNGNISNLFDSYSDELRVFEDNTNAKSELLKDEFSNFIELLKNDFSYILRLE